MTHRTGVKVQSQCEHNRTCLGEGTKKADKNFMIVSAGFF